MALGEAHTIAVSQRDHKLYAWGDYEDGQLGDPNITYPQNTAPNPIPFNHPIKQLAAAKNHSIALATDGTAYVWGNNTYGQLGLGDTQKRETPTPIPGHKFETIATDETTTIAVDTGKNTWIWGGDEWTRKKLGLDGDGTKPAKYQTGITPVKTIGVDEGSFWVVTETGEIYAWGDNSGNQLGLATGENFVEHPRKPGNTNYRMFAIRNGRALALDTQGKLYSWGRNNRLQAIGKAWHTSEGYQTIVVPFAYQVMPQLRFKSFTIGHEYAYATTLDNKIYAWGMCGTVSGIRQCNDDGGSAGETLEIGHEIETFYLGNYHSFGADLHGNIWAWGSSDRGQSGTGTTSYYLYGTKRVNEMEDWLKKLAPEPKPW